MQNWGETRSLCGDSLSPALHLKSNVPCWARARMTLHLQLDLFTNWVICCGYQIVSTPSHSKPASALGQGSLILG